jgi:hypothetical protein
MPCEKRTVFDLARPSFAGHSLAAEDKRPVAKAVLAVKIKSTQKISAFREMFYSGYPNQIEWQGNSPTLPLQSSIRPRCFGR